MNHFIPNLFVAIPTIGHHQRPPYRSPPPSTWNPGESACHEAPVDLQNAIEEEQKRHQLQARHGEMSRVIWTMVNGLTVSGWLMVK